LSPEHDLVCGGIYRTFYVHLKNGIHFDEGHIGGNAAVFRTLGSNHGGALGGKRHVKT
jgi:hypothetical protein